MTWSLLKKILFQLDAETSHELTLSFLSQASKTELGRSFLRKISGQERVPASASTRVWSLPFRNRVGLAAGFDKNARLLRALPHLGFGFAELGSVTPRPQPGNPKPRLFRNPNERSLWNSMGFNNDGADAIARRLMQAREQGWIPIDFPVGVNLGKNKDTSAESAHLDYLEGAKYFFGLADYLVVNVSSPNTAGLRSLQQFDSLKRIIGPIAEARAASRAPSTPLLLKLAPEVEGEQLRLILEKLDSWIDGWVLTNTLGHLGGGVSGAPLTELSISRLSEAIQVTSKPVLSSGGVLSLEDVQLRVNQGAALVQLYSGYVYQGPAFPALAAQLFA